jgi:hypothetical protein
MPKPTCSHFVSSRYAKTISKLRAHINIPRVSCGLYSQPVVAGEMRNVGQYRGPMDAKGKAFEVVIRGSNGKLIRSGRIILLTRSSLQQG